MTPNIDDGARYRILVIAAEGDPNIVERWLALATLGGDHRGFLDRIFNEALKANEPT